MTSILDVSTGTADDLHSVCLIIIAVPIISAYLESGVEMIPYMTRHNASCIITKVCVILDYDAGSQVFNYQKTLFDVGGFQLVNLIITELKIHMTC